MRRVPLLSRVAAALALASVVAACSRSSGDGATGAVSGASAPLPPTPALPVPSLGSAPTVTPGPDSVLTAEDAEDAAEHRITEQNLESELDRLEREIQAE